MKFTINKDKSTLTELTRRLFEIKKGPGAKAREKEIEASLRAANPHLADFENIPAGTPIVVPAIDVEANPKSSSVPPALVKQVRAQLSGLLKSLEKMQADEVAKLKQTQEILKSKDFKAAARETPALRKRLSKIDSAAAARLTELEQLRKSQQTGFKQLGKDLDDFIQRFL